MTKNKLSASRLREVLYYDPLSGIFTRLANMSNMKAGSIAGSADGHGYLSIMVDGVRYLAHRLAWLYVTGDWPNDQIDHSDLNRSNNSFANLRDATFTENKRNTRARKNNKVGLKGVIKTTGCHNRWSATISINSQHIHLGTFDSPEKANAAYTLAARRASGEFARGS